MIPTDSLYQPGYTHIKRNSRPERRWSVGLEWLDRVPRGCAKGLGTQVRMHVGNVKYTHTLAHSLTFYLERNVKHPVDLINIFHCCTIHYVLRCRIARWAPALQARSLRVWFPMGSLEFFTMALGSTETLTETSTWNLLWGIMAAVRKVDKVISIICQLLKISGTLNFLEP